MSREVYTRVCGVCGEEWIDTGEERCLFCGSSTFIKPDESDEGLQRMRWEANDTGG